MSGFRDLTMEGVRFGAVGVWSTGIYLVVSATASAAGAEAQMANAAGYAIGTAASFMGHFYWTFGKRSRHARALTRFLVVAACGYLLSAALMHAALDWYGAPFWAALVLVVTAVPGLSWLCSRYWAFN